MTPETSGAPSNELKEPTNGPQDVGPDEDVQAFAQSVTQGAQGVAEGKVSVDEFVRVVKEELDKLEATTGDKGISGVAGLNTGGLPLPQDQTQGAHAHAPAPAQLG